MNAITKPVGVGPDRKSGLSDEEIQLRLQIIDSGLSLTKAAAQIGIARQAMQSQIKGWRARAAERNLDGNAGGPSPLPEGFVIKEQSANYQDGELKQEWVKRGPDAGPVFELLPGHYYKGVSAWVDPEGRIRGQWLKTDTERMKAVEAADIVGLAMSKYKPVLPRLLQPKKMIDDSLTVYIMTDWHVGLFAWGKETGGGDWDLSIARKVLIETVHELVQMTPPSKHAVVLGLGDLLHADNSRNMTERSGNVLDVDSRYAKCLETTLDLVIEATELVASKHEMVEAELKPGNHDPNSTVALQLALHRHFHHIKRVAVSSSPSPWFWKRFGVSLIGGTHGHETKLTDLPLVVANIRKKDWSETMTRHVHTGHVHHKREHEDGGVHSFAHRAPVKQDAYHAARGYLSGRSMSAYHYHRTRGARGHSEVEII